MSTIVIGPGNGVRAQNAALVWRELGVNDADAARLQQLGISANTAASAMAHPGHSPAVITDKIKQTVGAEKFAIMQSRGKVGRRS